MYFMTINHGYKSNNHRNRKNESIEFLVLHYTAVPLATTLGIFTNKYEIAKEDSEYFISPKEEVDHEQLCKNEVSAHYVISEDGEIFHLVSEDRAAYHAGVSFWNSKQNINNSSIGIEQVNLGYDWLSKFPEERGVCVPGSDKTWCKFTEQQIEQAIKLCKEIIIKHDIKPYNIVGHSDIACSRKKDPGPLYPWKLLAEAGIGMWYDISESDISTMPENFKELMREKLENFGYYCPKGIKDEEFKHVMQAFQMHFRQSKICGEIDLECLQIADSLCRRKQTLELNCRSKENLSVNTNFYTPSFAFEKANAKQSLEDAQEQTALDPCIGKKHLI